MSRFIRSIVRVLQPADEAAKTGDHVKTMLESSRDLLVNLLTGRPLQSLYAASKAGSAARHVLQQAESKLDASGHAVLPSSVLFQPRLGPFAGPQGYLASAAALKHAIHTATSSSNAMAPPPPPHHVQYSPIDKILYPPPSAFIGQQAPCLDLKLPAVVNGDITTMTLGDFAKQGRWTIFFTYPLAFTFVCPTELIAFNDRAREFEALNCQLVAGSCDSAETNLAWVRTPRKRGGLGHMEGTPIVSDLTKEVSAKYGVLLQDRGIPLRGLFIIDPQGVLQQVVINSLPIGRSVDEALRLLQALQFYQAHGEVCPADWKPGDKTMIANPTDSLKYFSTVEDKAEDKSHIAPSVKLLQSKSELDDLIKTGKRVVVFCGAEWCGKCHQIGPHVESLQAEKKNVTFVKIDTTMDGMQSVADSLGVTALPHFKFYKDGKDVGKELGGDVIGYKKSFLSDRVAALAK